MKPTPVFVDMRAGSPLSDAKLLRVKLLLTPAEAASVLRISTNGVYRMAERGELEGVDVGIRSLRITSRSVIDYLDDQGIEL